MDERKILIIEDEKPIANILKYGFEKEGFLVECAYTGGEGFAMACKEPPDLVLLDWMLPDLSGVDVCRMLTEQYNLPIVMLTARGNMEDKLYGLESGADDYITKPFDLREVVARVRTILRRLDKANGREEEERCVFGELTVVEREHSVFRNGETLNLTPKEYELLLFFLKHPRQVFTRGILLDRIWGYDFAGDTRTVDIHVQRIRKKAGLDETLVTIFGVGYKYVP
ncbi:MAG: response regulator transcription factor [Lachnospiraceae bacterium]|jgi:two-component system alkaline phosphatase synthesis response regulator PhoP|nr:response regulator transcription factor [Lachnospiraceae bacterium]MCI8996173.1 response regulator transcription factor [Lachnospiraceae bacterium]MCI9134599.1 response regulator transcription factor [Lachnospiraceae bacterium]